MNKIIITFSLILISNVVNATPGDAAYRSGHFEQAAELYKKGAEQGDAIAAIKLAFIFKKVQLTSDFKTPLFWFEKACKLGKPMACHNAGYGYEEALYGLKSKDLNKAESLYRIAAEKGYMQSQYNLASMYSNNYVTPPNDIEGYKWFLISSINAEKCSDKNLCKWILSDPPKHGEKLKNRLTEEQIEKAEELAESWVNEN